MAFRDDHAAAIARADALQTELDRLRRERTQPSVPPKPIPKPKPPRVKPKKTGEGFDWTTILVFLFGTLIFVGPIAYLFYWDAARDAKAQRAAKVALPGCLDRLDAEIAKLRDGMPDRYDPRHDQVIPVLARPVAIECTKYAITIAGDEDLPTETRGILEQWDVAEHALDEPLAKLADYYAHRDWEEDDMRGARTIWKRLEPLLAQRDAMVRWAREAALPVVTASE